MAPSSSDPKTAKDPDRQRPRLRARSQHEPFHIVLVEPEIPPNTGNVARTCAATNSPLHLVGELGFDISEHRVRRAGLDYWHLVDLQRHLNFEAFEGAFETISPRGKKWFFSSHAHRSFLDADFSPGDALVFGRESVGLPPELLERHSATQLAIPLIGQVRSLNLATSVAIALYEALRKTGALGEAGLDPA